MRVWLIGENNPYGNDPRYALYPEPEHSAGGRLCRLIMGMDVRTYLRTFERRNLLQAPRWSAPLARAAAARFLEEDLAQPAKVILFGRKVFDAFDGAGAFVRDGWQAWEPFTTRFEFLILPHPSGLSRAWNEPGAFLRARQAVAEFAPELAPLLGSATPEVRT